MEGIILEPEALASPWGLMGALILLAIAFGFVLFGSMEEKERSGDRLYWAEWPLPEAADEPVEEELRLAA